MSYLSHRLHLNPDRGILIVVTFLRTRNSGIGGVTFHRTRRFFLDSFLDLFGGSFEVTVCSSEVCDENLCSFVEEDLATLIDSLVSEALKRVDNRLDKFRA